MKKFQDKKPCVYVISGVRNDWQLTKRMLDCFCKQSYKNMKVLIIDDGSTDCTVDEIRKNYPKTTVLEGDGNLWWTGAMFVGVNKVLEKCNSVDMVLTMNNDCTFNNKYVSELVKLSQNLNRAIVGSLAVDSTSKSVIIDAGVKIDWSKGRIYRIGPRDVSELKSFKSYENEIDTLPTKGTLYPVEVFKRIGNFNVDRLPHYVSDYEFACRAKNSGYKLVISYDAVVYNIVQRTGILGVLSKSITLAELNNLLFSRKSQINIVDHYNFISLCCPKKYKFINYFLLFGKLLYIVSFLKIFYPFRWPLVKLRKLVLAI